jgi:hypothetical protein
VHLIKKIIVFGFVLATVAVASPPQAEPPLSDTRLTVHTLLREDIFSGFMSNDMARFEKGEKNIDKLMELRPGQKGNLLAWKGGATIYRAVLAYENKQPDQFKKLYKQAQDYFEEARKQTSGNEGLPAILGGSYGFFADRLPKEYRAAAWSTAYDSYLALYKLQEGIIDRLPVHLKGEALAGLTQAAQRTGRKEETAMYLDKMLAVLGGTPYEEIARKWKSDPESAANSRLTCMTCHDQGRLGPTLGRLSAK